jgi:DNA primase catalytic core
MARIPEAEVERLKKEISVQRLAEARGIKLTRQGADLVGKCPFHDDRTPSLVITPAKNLWHCLGACNVGGDVIEWVMRAEGVSFRHAVELLRSDHLPSAASSIQLVKQSTIPKLPAPVAREADDRALLVEIVDYYSRTLKQSPEALKYLSSRGLQSSEIIDRFKLGFANRTLGYGLEEKNRVAGAQMRGRLQRLGILRESGHEHFNGSVVVPVFNASGEVVEMYGRKITAKLREGTPLHLYLKGEHRGVWNEEALIASKEIILCEALIDALTFWVAGYRNVTASYGVNGFTADHRAAFERHGTKRVYIAYDRDDAGERSALRLSEELMGMGIECFRVLFPKGQDANEYARTTQPAAKALGVLLTGAAWMGKGARPAGRVAVPVIVAEPVATSPAAAAPTIEPLPAEAKSTAKEKIIEEQTPEPVIEAAAQPGEAQAAVVEIAPEPASELAIEAAREPIPATVASEPPAKPAQPQQRAFSLAVNAVPLEEPAARPMPMSVPAEPKVEVDGDEVKVTLGPREYRVLGLEKCTSRVQMRVNVKVSGRNVRGEWCYHGDTLDMESARQRAAFVKQAAYELAAKEETVHREVGQLWTALAELQRERIAKLLDAPPEEALMTAEEQAEALALLRDPRLIERVLSDFELCGVVGEETNKKVSYLAAVSRLLDKPLAVVLQSSSAAGKSSLMEAVLDFMPEEQREEYSAMTGQALYYMGQKNLKHKILAVAEEEGASRASYALKLLQSEGRLKIASTGKDPVSGKLVTHEYVVEGPVMIFLTTTAQDVDEELLNRCLVLTVNEEQAQTQAIHRKQREAQTIEGLWARRERARIVRLHRNAQRLLKPIAVVNNDEDAAQDFPDTVTRTRRDHMKFLTLIQAVALLHQHQREIRTSTRNGETLEYIEATKADVKLAQELARHVLGPSLDDLPPHTRRLLAALDQMVTAECERLQIERGDYHFTRRTVREHTRWGDTQLRMHLRRLEEMEYLILRRGGGQGQTFVYQLRCDYDANFAGEATNFAGLESNFAGTSRAGSGGIAGGARGEESPVSMRPVAVFRPNRAKNTIEKETEITSVVAALHRNNGNGRMRDSEGSAWPA